MKTETLVETESLSIVRLRHRPREPLEGRHRKALVYVGVEVSTPQVISLLLDAADRLQRTLGPRPMKDQLFEVRRERRRQAATPSRRVPPPLRPLSQGSAVGHCQKGQGLACRSILAFSRTRASRTLKMAVAVAPPATVSFSRRALDSTPRRPPTPVARAVLVHRFDDEEPDARRVNELLDAFGRHDNRDAHAAGAADVQGVADARGLLEADLTSVSSVPQPQCVSERHLCWRVLSPRTCSRNARCPAAFTLMPVTHWWTVHEAVHPAV